MRPRLSAGVDIVSVASTLFQRLHTLPPRPCQIVKIIICCPASQHRVTLCVCKHKSALPLEPPAERTNAVTVPAIYGTYVHTMLCFTQSCSEHAKDERGASDISTHTGKQKNNAHLPRPLGSTHCAAAVKAPFRHARSILRSYSAMLSSAPAENSWNLSP